MLTLPLTITVVVALSCSIARLLTLWLANRPISNPDYSEEEILEELETAFVPRNHLNFVIDEKSVPVFLRRLTEAVSVGFDYRHAETLSYRMTHREMEVFYHAAYPVDVNGVACDLDFQWLREMDCTVAITVTCIDEVLLFATDAVSDLIIRSRF